jgi:uncharacterized membrane protein YidH (DUF202 family)
MLKKQTYIINLEREGYIDNLEVIMDLFLATMTNLGLFILINAVYLLVSTPIVSRYCQNNIMDNAKVLTSIFSWISVALIVAFSSAQLLA